MYAYEANLRRPFPFGSPLLVCCRSSAPGDTGAKLFDFDCALTFQRGWVKRLLIAP